jgi:hypothetical protein
MILDNYKDPEPDPDPSRSSPSCPYSTERHQYVTVVSEMLPLVMKHLTRLFAK